MLAGHSQSRQLAHRRSRGVAMALVLITLAVVFVMGMAMLEGLPSDARATGNLADHTAAVYLAESGLAEGLYRFQHPEGESEWTGVAGRTLDDSGNAYDVTVTDLGEGRYRLTSTAYVTGRRGQTVEHTLALVLEVDTAASGYTMNKAMVTGSGGFIPANATIRGDVHINGTAAVFGQVSGEVSATQWVLELGGGDVGSKQQYVESQDLPPVNLDDYQAYQYNGSVGSATVVDEDDVDDLSRTVNPTDAGNPLGVVIIDGDLNLQQDLRINNGILVVRGNINLNGHKLQVKGEQGQLSLLVEGHTIFSGSSELKVEKGAAYLAGHLFTMLNASHSSAVFSDGLVSDKMLPLLFMGQLEIDNKAYRQKGIETVRYFGEGSGDSAERVVTPIRYAVVSP